MANPLPTVTTIRDAVQEVIKNNRHLGATPTIFIRDTQNGMLPENELKDVVSKFIRSATAVEAVEKNIQKHNTFLTIEDFVVTHGARWGFDQDVIDQAIASKKYWDMLANGLRYA